jgi:hypothetical protein
MLKTCIFCGKTFEAVKKDTQYCSPACSNRYHHKNMGCPHNAWLICASDRDCSRCGWDPQVEARRKARLFAAKKEVAP